MCSSVQKRPKKISSFKDKHVFCVIICSLIFEIPIFFTLILDNYLVFSNLQCLRPLRILQSRPEFLFVCSYTKCHSDEGKNVKNRKDHLRVK